MQMVQAYALPDQGRSPMPWWKAWSAGLVFCIPSLGMRYKEDKNSIHKMMTLWRGSCSLWVGSYNIREEGLGFPATTCANGVQWCGPRVNRMHPSTPHAGAAT